jgi:hypothetical protein
VRDGDNTPRGRALTGLLAAKGSFTTTGAERQHVGGIGFRPVVVVSWWACQPTSGSTRGNRGGIGFWADGESAAVAWASRDGAASTGTSQLADQAALLGLERDGTAPALRAVVESSDDDGWTLRYPTPPAETWTVHFLALGGAASGEVGWTTSTRTPSPARRSVSRSSLLFLVPAPIESGVVVRDLAIGFGAEGTQGQAVAGYLCLDRDVPGRPQGAQRSDAAHLDWPEGRGQRCCYLRVDGVHAKVSTDVSPAASGVRHTHVGFRPEALMLFSWGLSHSTLWKTMGRLCVGGVAGGESGCVGWDDRDDDATETVTHVRSSTEHALVVADSQTGALHAQATVAALDSRGFALDWTSDGKRREFAYVALTARDPRGRVRRALDRLPHRSRRAYGP